METTIGYELGERLVNDAEPYQFSRGYKGGWRCLGNHILTTPGPGGIPHILSRGWITRRASKVRRVTAMIAAGDGKGRFLLGWAGIEDVHQGGVNLLFCDGHVRCYAQKALSPTTAQGTSNLRMWHYDNQP